MDQTSGWRQSEQQFRNAFDRARHDDPDMQAMAACGGAITDWRARDIGTVAELAAWLSCYLDFYSLPLIQDGMFRDGRLQQGAELGLLRDAMHGAANLKVRNPAYPPLPASSTDTVTDLHKLRAWCADAQPTTATETASASRSTGNAVARANKAMRSELESNPKARSWSAQKWGEKIGVASSTIHATAQWSGLMEDTGRGRRDRHSKTRRQPTERSLTDKLLSSRGDKRQPNLNDIDVGDQQIAKLLADQRPDDVGVKAIRSSE